MIKYLSHSQIDKQHWDACIKDSFNGIIYAYSWYLDIVSPGWEALVEDDYRRVMPLTKGKKFFIDYLYQPYIAQQLGVFSISKLNDEIVKNFLSAIPSKFKFIEINLNTFNNISPADFEKKEKITCELDLISSYEEHFRKFSENTKRNIKKASGHSLLLTQNESVSEIIGLFKRTRGKQLHKVKEDVYKRLEALINACFQNKMGHVWGIKNSEGKLIAGAFFIESHGKVIFIFSATSEEAKEKGAMFLLIDRFIFTNSNRNLVLDFEGSNIPELARFYKGFGARECVYLQIRKNKLPDFIKRFKK